MDRNVTLDRIDAVIDTVESETLPVPAREVWVYGDVMLGLDPLDRLDVYVARDILLRDDPDAAESSKRSRGVKGIGKSVRVGWAREHPDLLRINADGYTAPEKYLAAHLPLDEEPVHLGVYDTSFGDNVTQRLKGAIEHEAYEQILDPRDVCLHADNQCSSDVISKLRNDEFAFPTLSGALEILGLEDDDAETAVKTMRTYRAEQTGTSVRDDVV